MGSSRRQGDARVKRQRSGLDAIETAVHGVLIAGVVLAFSTGLQVQFTLPKLLILRAGTAALVLVWIGRLRRGETRRLPAAVAATTLLLGAWWFITTLTAVDPPTALEGAPGRYNGLSTNAVLLTLLAVTAASGAPIRHLAIRVQVLVASLTVAALYAMAQSAGLDIYTWPFRRPAATIGHPVTLATALGLGAPFALVAAFAGARGVRRWFWGVLFAVLLTGAGLTLSRGPLAGIAVSSSVALLLAAPRRTVGRRTLTITAALVLAMIAASGAYIVRHRSGRFLPNPAQLAGEPEIQNRLHTLRAAAAMMRDRPILGAGLENYHVLYPRYRPVEAERLTPDSVPTMVHSGYFQLVVTTGTIGLLLYLGFLAAVLNALIRAYRREGDGDRRLLLAACIASACGYLVSDLTGWPEVPIMALFCLVLGTGLSAGSSSGVVTPRGGAMRVAAYSTGVAAVVVLVLLTHDAVRMVQADAALRSARMSAAEGDWPGAAAATERALILGRSRAAATDAAASILAERFGQTGDAALYERAAHLFEGAYARAPFSEYVMIHRVDLETARLQKQKGGAPAAGANQIAAALLAHELHNATVYESLARMRLAAGDAKTALAMIARAQALRPQRADYWRLEGDARRSAGDRPAAVAAYRHAIAGMEPASAAWIGAERRLIVTMIEAGDSAAAIDEAGRVLALVPSDELTRRLLDAAIQARRPGFTGS